MKKISLLTQLMLKRIGLIAAALLALVFVVERAFYERQMDDEEKGIIHSINQYHLPQLAPLLLTPNEELLKLELKQILNLPALKWLEITRVELQAQNGPLYLKFENLEEASFNQDFTIEVEKKTLGNLSLGIKRHSFYPELFKSIGLKFLWLILFMLVVIFTFEKTIFNRLRQLLHFLNEHQSISAETPLFTFAQRGTESETSSVSPTSKKSYKLDELDQIANKLSILIKEHKRHERAHLSLKEKAEQAVRSKNLFLSNMSHELKTPLNFIMGISQILMDENLNPRQKEFLQNQYKVSEELLTMIEEILEYVNWDSDGEAAQKVLTNLGRFFEELSKQSEILVKKKNNQFEYIQTHPIPKQGVLDQNILKRVLVELIRNANKHTQNGSIRLIVSPFGSSMLEIKVQDTGTGIETKELNHIFQPLKQIDESTTKNSRGIGIGLAICRRRCQLLEGELRVESEPHRGTSFTLIIPI